MTAEATQVNPRPKQSQSGSTSVDDRQGGHVVDPITKEILWSDYLRHQTKQAEFVLAFLERIGAAFPNLPKKIRTFITGSGGSPIGPHMGRSSSRK